MATNDPICRERKNDRKEEEEDSDGESKQMKVVRRRIGYYSRPKRTGSFVVSISYSQKSSSKAVFRTKTPLGVTRDRKLASLIWKSLAKDGGEAADGTDNQGNRAGREGNLGTGTRVGSQDSS